MVQSIPDIMSETVARCGDQPAVASIKAGTLHLRTWRELEEDVCHTADCLQQLDVAPADRVAHYAPNSYEWIVTDLAILSLGAVHVPLHASLPCHQANQLVERADPRLVVVQEKTSGFSVQQVTYDQLRRVSGAERNAPSAPVRSVVTSHTLQPDSLATILFTSGTTGEPRGVMLSHRNLVENCLATAERIGGTEDEIRLALLPFSHIYARTCDLYVWLSRGTRLVLAESRDTFLRDCQLAKPTVINAVPYFHQKIAQQLVAARQAEVPGALNRLLGGRVERCFCGGAPISPETEDLFGRQGLPLLLGYGLTETSPVIATNSLDQFSPGSVGRPLSNLEVELAADGELLVRGPSVMQGYWQDEVATSEVLVDGWLHTGDLGEIDADGFLRIVGRKKEIIVLATGKNVSPTEVEWRLADSQLIQNVCVVGDGRNCLVALIVPNPEALPQQAGQRQLSTWTNSSAETKPPFLNNFRTEIDRLLADAPHEQQIGPFAVLPENFSSERGELTPKLSLCREAILASYSGLIEQLYAESTNLR